MNQQVVMTLDAGGTNFRFSALRDNRAVTPVITTPSYGDDLDRCLANIVHSFTLVRAQCPAPPAAISFAFPGPADYPHGIIGDLGNLPGFRGGVALGPMLEEEFGIPVFINNDGDLFAYGEATAGFLPYVNDLLAKAGSPKRYRNLLGVTLGTGFGGGIVRNGDLFLGDNSMAAEMWLLRNKLHPQMDAEEGASIRAVRRAYAEETGIPFEQAPDPRAIAQIASGEAPGDRNAAVEAYRRLGEVVGDAMAQALTLVDGLAVIGGGLSNAHRWFLPALVAELNGAYASPDGTAFRRLTAVAFNLEDESQLAQFLKGDTREVTVPSGTKTVLYDRLSRLGIGISRLGTSEAIALGAYAFALRAMSEGGR
jgi:glucokinase